MFVLSACVRGVGKGQNENGGNKSNEIRAMGVAELKEKVVEIRWQKVKCEGYRIYKTSLTLSFSPYFSSPPTKSSEKLIAVLPSSEESYRDYEVEASRHYIYRIEAFEGDKIVGETRVEVRTPFPPSVESAEVEVISSELVIIRWKGKGDVYSYEVTRADEKGVKILAEFPSGITYYPDGSLEGKGRKCWYIRGSSAWGEDEREVCWEGGEEEGGLPPPPSPANLKVVRTESGKVELSWDLKGGMGYKILRCEVGGNVGKEEEEEDGEKEGEDGNKHCTPYVAVGIAPEGATSYVDEVGKEGEYCYRVQAYGEGGDSGFSNTVCVEINCSRRFYYDIDGDGFGSLEVVACQMPLGATTVSGDCDDSKPDINPSVKEGDRVFSGGVSFVLCDGIDNDCDGTVDEGCECKDGEERRCYSGAEGTDGVGECRAGIQKCQNGTWGMCEGQVLPEGELCDGKDNDCDGKVDEADYAIPFTRPSIGDPWTYIGDLFTACVRFNPDYPYSITTEDETIDSAVVIKWEIKYYVLNSLEEWNELCKNNDYLNTDYLNIVKDYVDFTTQTILGFVFSTTSVYYAEVRGCSPPRKIISMLKVLDDTIFAEWGPFDPEPFKSEFVHCTAVFRPPFYDAIVTGRKLYNPFIVTKFFLKDSCPYNP
ncbi:MAG: putative metal-binding motif-containing protein [Candidatus Aenigmatarchaeota archaeon]